MKSAWAAIRSAVLSNPWAAPSIISAWGWGISLAMPGDTLSRPTYRYMDFVADELVWTLLFLTIAILQTWRLFKRTTHKLFRYELALKGVAAAVWTFVALVCFTAQWPLAAAMSDSVAVAFCAWMDMLRLDACHGCPFHGAGMCTGGCHLARSA